MCLQSQYQRAEVRGLPQCEDSLGYTVSALQSDLITETSSHNTKVKTRQKQDQMMTQTLSTCF